MYHKELIFLIFLALITIDNSHSQCNAAIEIWEHEGTQTGVDTLERMSDCSIKLKGWFSTSTGVLHSYNDIDVTVKNDSLMFSGTGTASVNNGSLESDFTISAVASAVNGNAVGIYVIDYLNPIVPDIPEIPFSSKRLSGSGITLDGTNINDNSKWEKINKFNYINITSNQFQNRITIGYSLAEVTEIKIQVFTLASSYLETLIDARQQPGSYNISWSKPENETGVYLFRVSSKGFIKTFKGFVVK